MNPSNLQLFPLDIQSTSRVTSPSKIDEDKIVQPLTEVLVNVTPTGNTKPTQSLTKSLDELFPEQEHQEKQIKRTKEILGNITNEFTDIQLQGVVIEIQYLAESWLDNFEREIFDGLTLKELLHEKGGT